MSLLPSGLQAALLLTMLSIVLSRSLCQVVAGGKLSTTLGSALRAFSTSIPESGEDSGNGSNKLLPVPLPLLNSIILLLPTLYCYIALSTTS